MIRAVFKSMAFLAKNVILTYQWLHPEVSLSRCVAQYARREYPELMQTPMTYDNIAKFVRTVYNMVSSSITEYMNENRQEVKLERERIGAKLAQITADDTMSLNRGDASMATSMMVLPSVPSHQQPSTSLLPPSPTPSYTNVNMVQNINDILNRYRRSQGKSEYMKRSNDFLLTKRKDFDVSNNDNDEQNKLRSRMNEFDTTAAGKSISSSNNNNISPSNEIILSFKTQAKDNLIPMPLMKTKMPTTTTAAKRKTATNNIKDINATEIATATNSSETNFPKTIESKDNFNLTLPIAKTKDSRFTVMYAGPRQFPNGITDINSNSYTDAKNQQQQQQHSDVSINEVTATYQNSGAATKNNEKTESIFDFENAILETFGFHRGKGVQSVSLTGCTQKYVINILWRMVEDFVTGA